MRQKKNNYSHLDLENRAHHVDLFDQDNQIDQVLSKKKLYILNLWCFSLLITYHQENHRYQEYPV